MLQLTMDLDSLTLEELHFIVEGMYCFAIATEPSRERMQQLVLDLMEWHETTDEDVLDGLAYYSSGQGQRPNLQYSWENRQRHFEEELGYKEI